MKGLQITLAVTIALLVALLIFACGQTGTRRMPNNTISPASIDVAAALAELDALQAPKGVTPALFAQIKDALRTALIARGTSKIACTPPTGAANHIPGIQLNDAGGGMYNLIWRYYNVGDYNQDGSVGIADITPLAMHYGEGWVTGEENSLPAVVDGSGNGTVDIADVTPIAMNFGVDCASYEVQISDAEDGTFALVDTVYLDTGTGKDTGRMMFTYNYAPTPSQWYRVIARDAANTLGEGSGAMQAPGPAGEAPVADIQAVHYMGYAPLSVNFDADNSVDPDGGEITLYEWDADGDGVFEGHTGTTAFYDWEYLVVGDYTATVRVFDDEGLQDTASMTINVYAAPDYDEVEDNDDQDGSATPLPAIPFEGFTGSIGEDLPTYIGYDGDWEDNFSFNATIGDTITFAMEWSLTEYAGSLAIIDSDGDTLQSLESDASPFQLTYTFVDGDTAPFYLEVYSYWGCAEYFLKGVEGTPPFADLIATPTNGPTPLTVNFDASGSTDVVSYAWDFLGDGTFVAGGAVESFDYAIDGWYRAAVQVTDADGLVASASITITAGDIGYDEVENNDGPVGGDANLLPPIPFSGFRGSVGDSPDNGYTGYDGDIEDYYTFSALEGETVTITVNYNPATSGPVVLLYDSDADMLIGCGDTNPRQIVYMFGPGDNAPFYLDIYDFGYTDYTIDIMQGSIPYADIIANPEEGAAPLEVTFDARWSSDYDGGIISTYEWDWDGDGSWDDLTVDAFPVLHTFTADGLYQTILRVTDEEGQQDEDIIWIFVPNAQAYYDEDEPNDSVATANQLPPFDFVDWHGSVGHYDQYFYVGYDGGNDDCLLFDPAVGAGDTVHFHATFDAHGGEMNLALWDF